VAQQAGRYAEAAQHRLRVIEQVPLDESAYFRAVESACAG